MSAKHTVGVFFVVIAGCLSKVLIAEAFSTFAAKDSFVDVGSALDGYAGKASKDFIKIPHYCQTSVNWVPPDGLERKWMVDGVCKGTEYHKTVPTHTGKRYDKDTCKVFSTHVAFTQCVG